MNSSARIPPETRKAPRASASLVSVPIDARLKSDRQVRSLAARIDELTTQLAAIEAHTRGTLAQDLHDEMGAVLTAANLAISRAQYWLPANAPAACADALRQARDCIAEAGEASHRIVEDLQAPPFDTGFITGLADWIATFGARAAIHVDFVCPDDSRFDDLPPGLAVALLRVMQEALTNVARHARATRARVSVERDAQGVTLVIDDDGIGMTPAARRKTGRFGLPGMRARCEAFGGSMRVAASEMGGVAVHARIPLVCPPRPVRRAANA
ncbi:MULTISPECIES: ATP-binding protein [unclassified Caballeronia]|uniref:sensor histidine kinase n=1 Tax=unclassified Caballeronia TaxID=2646786 RepID=UPI00285E3396|nr:MULTISPECIES: ATP-binding protein [unclassified Caballeronia]MDR5773014.1 histidine kinase [Caballeronia sp. LZ002]MDR5848448.1 histidine kinase [Caballeronia sp. LZ003]